MRETAGTQTAPDLSVTDARAVVVDARAVVVGFLDALAANELDAAVALLAPDALWINVSLPTVRGRRAIERLCRALLRVPGAGFAVVYNHVVADADVVITDRRDELRLGRLRFSFWVYGRFTVTDGRITVWRDSFDNLDVVKGLLRGLIGVVLPPANRRLVAH